MRASARGSVFEHEWAEVAELAGALCTSLPLVVSLAYLVLNAIDLHLLGPIDWPICCTVFCVLALSIVLPLALSFALAFVLPFALALSWAFRVPSALGPPGIGLIV